MSKAASDTGRLAILAAGSIALTLALKGVCEVAMEEDVRDCR